MAKVDDVNACSSESQNSMAERTFERKMRKAGWHTYRDEESGRIVTNAYESEIAKIESMSGLKCEMVSAPLGVGCCGRVGPKMQPRSDQVAG